MRNRIAFLFFLLSAFFLYAQEEEYDVEEYIVPEDSPLVEYVYRQVYYGDIDTGILYKVEQYMSDAYTAESNVYLQIDYYCGNDYPVYYEMFFNNSSSAETGLSKRVDFVDLNDNLTLVEFHFINGTKVKVAPSDMELVTGYGIRRIGYYMDNYYTPAEELYDNPDDPDKIFNFEMPVYRGITAVEYSGEKEPVTDRDRKLISGYMSAHEFEDSGPLYNEKIKVNEYGNDYWICFQDSFWRNCSRENSLPFFTFISAEQSTARFLPRWVIPRLLRLTHPAILLNISGYGVLKKYYGV